MIQHVLDHCVVTAKREENNAILVWINSSILTATAVSFGSGASGKKDPADLMIEKLNNEFGLSLMYGQPTYSGSLPTPPPTGSSPSSITGNEGHGPRSYNTSVKNKKYEFDYDAARARVFEFTQDWNKINKLEHMGDIINLFNYYLDNPSQEGEVYNGGFLFLKTLAHYQTGLTDVLLVDAAILDLSQAKIERHTDLGFADIKFPGVDWKNLFTLSSIMNFANLSNESLSIGKVKATLVDNGYLLNDDTYDFNIEWAKADWNVDPAFGSVVLINMLCDTFKSGRNIANSIGGFIHNVPFLFSGNYGAFSKTSFKLRFTGVAK